MLANLKIYLIKQPLIIPLIVLAIGISLTGYGLIKNLKSNNQSASAEQLPGTPESGAKSRIAELYDALVAQNKGSDTDVSGLTAAPGDWGAKWNRIKTAALKGSSGGGGSGLSVFSNSPDPEVNFIDNNTGLEWSNPLYLKNGQVKASVLESKIDNSASDASENNYRWSWNANHANNRAAGNKTAIQLCQALGGGWRLPSYFELSAIRGKAPVMLPGMFRWSLAVLNVSDAIAVNLLDDYTVGSTTTNQSNYHGISCVR